MLTTFVFLKSAILFEGQTKNCDFCMFGSIFFFAISETQVFAINEGMLSLTFLPASIISG